MTQAKSLQLILALCMACSCAREVTTEENPVSVQRCAAKASPHSMSPIFSCTMSLADNQINSFLKNGYVIVREAVPINLIDAALVVTGKAYAEGEYDKPEDEKECPENDVITFKSKFGRDSAVLSLITDSPLYEILEQLLGQGNTLPPTRGVVKYRIPKGSGSLDEPPNPTAWHVDEKSQLGPSFTAIVGVALSEGQEGDANHGQFLVWPGSHLRLHKLMNHRNFRKAVPRGERIFPYGGKRKPRIGKPVRVLLAKGDAVIAHRRLAHLGGPNCGESIRKNVYFRIVHRLHPDSVRTGSWQNNAAVFSQFDGIAEEAIPFADDHYRRIEKEDVCEE